MEDNAVRDFMFRAGLHSDKYSDFLHTKFESASIFPHS
jgi:hypothetical protein